MVNGDAAMTGYRLVSALGLGFAVMACSGRVGVGFESVDEPGGASSAGAMNAGGSGFVGRPGSGGSATTGAMPGMGDPSVCNYSPNDVTEDASPLLASDEVLRRIYRFLEDDETLPAGALPPAPSPSWAAARAKGILDGHAAAGTAAPGLERFLRDWLAMDRFSSTAGVYESPAQFARKLVEPDATLETLLAEPTGQPHRFGILNHTEFLSSHATITARGKWMSTRLFCREVPDQPTESLEESLGEGETRRERLENGVAQPVCQGCHQLMDPPGYSLEHFDETGEYRELDNGHPVNAASVLSYPPASFSDFSELAPQLANSCLVGQCFTRLGANHAFGTSLDAPVAQLSEPELNRVALDFAESGYSIRTLVDSIVRSPSFLR